MRVVRRSVVLGVLLAGLLQPLLAQIRLLPQRTIDSVANPPTVEERVMRFEREEISFGTIDELGGAWQGSLRWRNESDRPLVITRLVTSCSCLKADFGREPVAAGEEAELRITYHPKGHPGVVRQRLFVYTNRSKERPTAIVTLRGVVLRDSDQEARYPHRCGALLLKSAAVALARTNEVQRIEIACLNESDRPLTPQLDTLLTPRCLTLRVAPRMLPPQGEGRLLIEYDPQRAQGRQPIRALYLQGSEAPSRRCIVVRWKMEE